MDNNILSIITTAKASQGIQNPLPKGVTVQVRPRAPYLNDKASTLVEALLYLAQSKAYACLLKNKLYIFLSRSLYLFFIKAVLY